MTITERADRLAQLREELAKAEQAHSLYQSNAAEGYALAADHQPGPSHTAYTRYAVRCKGQALVWGSRCGELMVEIAALQAGPASLAAPVVLTAEQCAAVDETIGALA